MEEVKGLIRVYKNGHVERLPVMPEVPNTRTVDPNVTSRDIVLNYSTGVWARFYMPKHQGQLPLLVYFHGGGFCVGSPAWVCYHDFLTRLSARASCIIVSVNYRLAPEHRLPAAYEDGLIVMKWVSQQAVRGGSDEHGWWRNKCNFGRVFVGGDSAGANIAHYVVMHSTTVSSQGMILIQPFFGGEGRTTSEKILVQPPSSALSLETSDSYWRLALPAGSNRDHPWCNPISMASSKSEEWRIPAMLVCISEMDILKDRNLEFCKAMRKAGKSVEQAIYNGVGHAFQVLDRSYVSQTRTNEMLTHIKCFIGSK